MTHEARASELGSRPRAPLTLALAAALGVVVSSSDASAQVHWDASAQLGVMKRVLANRPNGGDDAAFGPAFQLAAHIALVPLVHVGGYVGHDISSAGNATRDITFGGLRAKGMIPFVQRPLRAWVFAGFGYAGVSQHSYDKTILLANPLGEPEPHAGRVEGAGGGFFEVPFGVGASYILRRPWELCAEIGARVGFGHTGSVYTAPGPQLTIPNDEGQNVIPAGLDRFALGLTVGVLMDL